GPTLKQVIDSEGPFSADAALDILAKLASAIAHAHANGVVHRDLKTSNIVLTDSAKASRQPVVVDFGIALMIEDDAEISLQSNLTRTNAVIGSPLYMSPEQVQGKRANERSDIYSLGCIFYECLTGYPPYQGETLLDTMNMHLNEPLPRIVLKDDQADLAARLNFVLDLTLAKNPSQRFATMEKLLESIEKSAQGFIAIRTDTPEEHQID
ncbi:MAG: serine/threonine protein kinase, partial [Cyanobacteria bacterium HKST-UBA01]|nr:serine/threonine protein kinase [Cyanobacteria bacterium HKST-UBA01]